MYRVDAIWRIDPPRGETQFVVGIETAPDVCAVAGAGVAAARQKLGANGRA
jgi:hypothetical protein